MTKNISTIGIAKTSDVVSACAKFIEAWNDHSTLHAWRNGSIWVLEEDLRAGHVNEFSFIVRGPAGDNVTRQHAQGFALLVDLDGYAEFGMLRCEFDAENEFDEDDVEVDDDGEITHYKGYKLYSFREAREELAYLLECCTGWRGEQLKIDLLDAEARTF